MPETDEEAVLALLLHPERCGWCASADHRADTCSDFRRHIEALREAGGFVP